MTNLRQAARLFHPDVRKYLITSALLGFSYFGMITVVMNLYLLRLGYGTGFIGLVNGATALAFATVSVPAGAIGARWGERRATIVGVITLAAGITLLPFAPLLPAAIQEVAIIATRLLAGIGFSLYLVNAQPYLAAATSGRERAYAFAAFAATPPATGFLGGIVAGVLPGVVAPILGVGLDHPTPFAATQLIAGVMFLPAIFVIASAKDRRHQRPQHDQGGGDDRSEAGAAFPVAIVLVLALSGFLRVGGEGAARSFFNVLLEVDLGQPPERIGLLVAIGNLVAGPAAMLGPAMAARTGKVNAVAASTITTAAGLLLMALSSQWWLVGVGFVLTIGSRAVAQSVASVIQMEIVPVARRAVTAGAVSTAMGTGFTTMALGGGALIPAIGFHGLYLIAAAMVAGGAILFWVFFRRPKGTYRDELDPDSA